MPFDPSLPANGTAVGATEMRSQLQALKALIDAIVTLTAAQVDGVTTLNPGDAATASVSVTGGTLHFQFGLPPGNDGPMGPGGSNGTNGNDGAPGVMGPPGPAFANAIVDAVNTLAPGSAATVSVFFDGSNVHFTFGLPGGADGNPGTPGAPGIDGTNGSNGTNGLDGAPGAPGPPGEVTTAQLSTAIDGTSSNTNGVATMVTPFTNDPPTLADIELMRAKVNELILALRR